MGKLSIRLVFPNKEPNERRTSFQNSLKISSGQLVPDFTVNQKHRTREQKMWQDGLATFL